MGYAETPGSAVDLVLNDLQIILADTYCLGFYEFNPTGIQPESPQILPGKFSLQAFPNPFNASTVLSFQLQVASFVKLEVFDINGRTVGARHAVPLQKGWLPGSPSSGIVSGDREAGVVEIEGECQGDNFETSLCIPPVQIP